MDHASAFALLAALDTEDGAIYERVRETYAPHLGSARDLPPSLVRSVIRHGSPKDLTRVGAAASDEHANVDVFASATPAASTLRFLRHTAQNRAVAYLRPMAALTALLGRRLGADPLAWSRLVALLPDFAGTIPDLVEAAATGSGGRTPIPAPARTVQREWRQLLLFAPPEHLVALIPHLRPATLFDLAHFGARLPATTAGDVVGRATPKQRLSLACGEFVRPEVVDALIDLRDPEIAAAIYVNSHRGERARNRIMAEAGEVPLSARTVARVTAADNSQYRRPALWSGDPVLTRVALLRVRDSNVSVQDAARLWREGGVEALRPHFSNRGRTTPIEPFVVPGDRSLLLGALLALWERHGVDEVRGLIRDLPTAAATTAALEAMCADGEAGRARMRAEFDRRLAKASDALDAPGLPRGCVVGAPGYPGKDWETIVARHRETPFAVATARSLDRYPGCPPEIVARAGEDALASYWPAPTGWATTDVAREPYAARTLRTRLKKTPGLADSVFNGTKSAEDALDLYADIGRYATDPALRESLRARMAAHIDEFLGTSIDARVVAARMAPSFEGTLPELLATAAAATL